jgi:hypothetical protein
MKLSNNIIFINFNIEINKIIKKNFFKNIIPLMEYKNNYIFKYKDIKKLLKDNISNSNIFKWFERFNQYEYLIINIIDNNLKEQDYRTVNFHINLEENIFKKEVIVEDMVFKIFYDTSTINITSKHKKNTSSMEYILCNEIFNSYSKEVLCDMYDISLNTYNKYLKDVKNKKYTTNY